MAIRELRVSGYRSIRQIRLGLERLSLVTGPSSCGKHNLFRALTLIRDAATGGFAKAIASEGGLKSVLWAGVPKRFGHQPELQRLRLGIRTENLDYEIECGLPDSGLPEKGFEGGRLATPASHLFLDPEIKMERARSGSVVLLDRKGRMVSLRQPGQRLSPYSQALNPSESALPQIQELHVFPELMALRTEIERWRFYDSFGSGPDAPGRRPQAGVLTPVLSQDASDLAAALQTVIEIGDADALRESIEIGFPGSRLEVLREGGRFRTALHVPGVVRPVEAAELSESTLRYLCLAAALLSPQPPDLLVLNKPEAGLHPDLIPALAHVVAYASKQSQVWIATRERALGEKPIELQLVDGETRIA